MARISLLLCFLFLAMMNSNLILRSSALQFIVGGQDGWVINPKESYDHWAQRLRFQVNDTLLFRYSNATDSVLAVSKSDFDNCNVNNPVIQLYGGDSIFQFGHSGPFYFITGNKTNCDNGQKVLILVLAVRSPPASPTTPPPPAQTPTTSPPSLAPSPSGSLVPPPASSPSPSGSVPPPPASSPSPSPSGSTPTPPPASSPSPSPSGSVTPSSSPASSPEAQTPAAGSPSSLVSPTSPVGPGGGNAPADINAPAASTNKSSATATFTPTVSTLAVSFFFIMALGWSTIFY